MRVLKRILFVFILGFFMCEAKDTKRDITTTRIPAEWEKQEATWMQWPLKYEKNYRDVFIDIIKVVSSYQNLNLIVLDEDMEYDVRYRLKKENISLKNINFFYASYDNSWLRDNGPVYVEDNNRLFIEDFGFDAWGGNFGDEVEYKNDNKISKTISRWTNLSYEDSNEYILERGNLEANGVDTVILNWDCQNDRNPSWSKEKTNKYLKNKFGVKKVIWIDGHDPLDNTTGHIDGMVRFISENKVAVLKILNKEFESYDGEMKNLDLAAKKIEKEGFEVVRIPMYGFIKYKGEELTSSYMNYLLGNGFVLAMKFGNKTWDEKAWRVFKELYPNRDIHMINANELWLNGGGIHCVTNDEPYLQ